MIEEIFEIFTYPFLIRNTNLVSRDYFEINTDVATMDCYIYNPLQKRWDAAQGYWISYSLTGNLFPFVEKYERYEDNKIYSDEKIINYIISKNERSLLCGRKLNPL